MSEQPWPTLAATHGGRAHTGPSLSRSTPRDGGAQVSVHPFPGGTLKIRRISAAAAALAAGALVLTACSNTPTDTASPSASAAATPGGNVVVAETNEFFSFNSSTANGNTDINSKVSLATNSNFYYIDDE